MELLGPGGSLERFNYEKLPRIAQYEVIKEVLWTAYQDTWRYDSTKTSKEYKFRKRSMKFAMKNLLDHLGLSTKPRDRPKPRKRPVRKHPPLGAGFGGFKRRDIGQQPARSTVEIFLPSIEEEPTVTSSFKKMPKTSLFFRPSQRLAHLYKNSNDDSKMERIRIAAGLRTRDHLPKRADGIHYIPEGEYFSLQKPQMQGFRLPQLGYNARHGNPKYGSSHYSVYDPLSKFGDHLLNSCIYISLEP